MRRFCYKPVAALRPTYSYFINQLYSFATPRSGDRFVGLGYFTVAPRSGARVL